MNGLSSIACGIGLQDALNPCIFMTCAVFIAHGLWLASSYWRMCLLRFIFVLVYALGFLEFNFGYGQIFALRKEFIFTVKILYLIFGIGAFILGVLFLRDWFLLNRGLPAQNLTDAKIKPFASDIMVMGLTTVALAVFLSAMSTLAPVNNYIFLLGSETLLKGLWQEMLPLLGGYIFCSMWPLWAVWAFLSIKNLRPSLIKIIYASIFFTASTCVIFFIK